MNFQLNQELHGIEYTLCFVVENYTPIQGEKCTEYKDVLTTLIAVYVDGNRISISEFNQEIEKLKKKEQKELFLK